MAGLAFVKTSSVVILRRKREARLDKFDNEIHAESRATEDLWTYAW